MPAARRPCQAALLGAALLLTACTAGGPPDAEPGPEPWADRPVVELRFDVADDLESVAGRERVVFTPDLATCELVFRAWPNKPATARAGNSLTVSRVLVDGQDTDFVDLPAGAPEGSPSGTLVDIPLVECAEPGDSITVELEFDLELGEDVDERMGTSSTDEVAWFATAFPLLAWERGQGWDRGDAVAVTGEMAVSEDFELESLEVVAPSGLEVFGAGTSVGTSEGPAEDTTVHEFTAPAVRDVSVTVGELDVAEREIDGIQVHLAADASADAASSSEWLDQIEASMEALVDLLGPFPYPDLWVSVLSSESSGIEFPGAIQFGDVDPEDRRALVTHELAHMWFYGLVGNNQGADPWLDESFSTFAQLVADGEEDTSYPDARRVVRENVGAPITFWADYRRPSAAYYESVYDVGGAALLEGRRRAGPDAFDAALRDYVRANAFTIAEPEDVEEAFADLPEVLTALRQVGALR